MDRLQVKIEIDRLNQEIEELKAENAKLHSDYLKDRSEIEILRDDLVEKFEMAVRLENMARDKEIEELKSENARYREALERIEKFTWSRYIGAHDLALKCKLIAREALKDGE